MANPLPKEYYQQLEEIQAADFVVLELILYLDTHPHDPQALVQYKQFAQYSKQLKQAFEAQFGPLQQNSPNTSTAEWTWSTSPWPWQV
ncbi:spore coat protein CotJB [Domibacillus indicus]|uniref:spore coat protein CotJB n=1 Tax=Domibacillus indicus TaxID=1437523 RepID=UPI00203EF8DB|nr:spore coat protein CotJB [Domibacillus indicus]MCM3790751.1 spore coat protein CotJB [Domibacillus indicus]